MKVIASEITANMEPWAQRAIDGLPAGRRRTVLDFFQTLSDEGVNMSSFQTYLKSIKTLNGGAKPYTRLTEFNLRDWARGIDQRYKPQTARLYKFNVKRFLKWLNGGKCPGCVSWIKPKRGKRSYGREILSRSEVKQLVDAASNQRDRALFFVAYESGARASELANLKIKDVSFDQYGAIIRIGRGPNAKTGERRVRLFESVPDLQLWMSMHPFKDNPEAPLWPSHKFKDKPIHRRTLIGLSVKYARKAGLKQQISPHTFRHSRATHLASVLKEAAMREYFGWSKASDMPSVYVHLSGRDVDQALFEHYGIKERKETQDNPLKKKVCGRCKADNSVSARFCWRCWAAFDTTKAEELTAKALEVLRGMVNPAQFREELKQKGLDREITKLARGG